MNKEELKNKLEFFAKKSKDFAQKSKAFTLDAASKIKEKSKELLAKTKAKYKTFKLARQSKKSETKFAQPAYIYDNKDKELKTSSFTSTIKPMAQTGQKVFKGRALFDIGKNLFSRQKIYFSKITISFIYLALSFIPAWLLGLSFARESCPVCAFIAFFIIGFALRYIQSFFGSLIYGLLTGFFSNLYIFGWIFDTIFFGTGDYFLAFGGLIGLALLLALPFVFFAFAARQYKNKLLLYPFASACAWVGLELLNQLLSYKFFGFPWFVLGYCQYANLELIQISSLLGAYGVSFFIVFCSFSSTLVLGKDIKFQKRLLNLFFILAIWFLFTSYGKEQLNLPSGKVKTFQVAIIQPNTHIYMLENDISKISQILQNFAQKLQSYENISLVIWPESTLPGYLEHGLLKDFMAQTSLLTKTAQIAGATAQEKEILNKNHKNTKAQNNFIQKDFVAAGLYQNGALTAKHYKRKLVPFGEFLPFPKQLQNFYDKNNITSLTGTFFQGSGPASVLNLSGEQKLSFGVQICFESIFPILWRLEALGGAEFFVNISNDGWFLDTAAPYQHLRTNVFRAVENRLPVLRSASSGLSAFIASNGQILYQTKLNEESLDIVQVSIPLEAGHTFYTIYGDIFGFLCLFLAIICFYNCLGTAQDYD